jgi:FtsX-like permease family protein
MLALIGTATRLATARREERFAAMRLVGATQTQVGLVAGVEATAGALLGTLIGIGGYTALHPALAGLSLIGSRFFPTEITPTGRGYVAVLAVVPVAAALAALASLHRVRVSPLGVTRRVTPPAPTAARLLVLAAGLTLFWPLLSNPGSVRRDPRPAVFSLIVIMVGLIVAGPWLIRQTAWLLASTARRGPALLAARRLADHPRSAYRPLSGVVLAVMVGTALATVSSAALAAQRTTELTQLAGVLRAGFAPQSAPGPTGLPPARSASLLSALTKLPGVHVVPVYSDRGAGVIACTDLRYLPALGTCPSGAGHVLADVSGLFTDNLATMADALPLITSTTTTTADTATGRNLITLLVTTTSPGVLEQARTVLSRYTLTADPNQAPQTFGEVAHARATLEHQAQQAATIVAALTLLIAGCSLAVAVSGGILERKRPFTLLRLTGTPVRALYRVVVLETVPALLAATLLAATVGFTVALSVVHVLAPGKHGIPQPDRTYYLTLGGGLVAAVAVILTCLPILHRITVTDNARFE